MSKDVNFGFNVLSQDGNTFKGQLEYQDKRPGININLHSEQMTSLRILPDGKTGIFSGTATVNGVAGYSFTITVVDNGEPGKDDTFRIVINGLSSTYDVSGTLSKGNIQVHK